MTRRSGVYLETPLRNAGLLTRIPFILECHYKGKFTLGNPKALNSAFATVNKTLINGNS